MLRCTSVMPSRGRPLFFRTSELASSSRAAATMAKGPLLPAKPRNRPFFSSEEILVSHVGRSFFYKASKRTSSRRRRSEHFHLDGGFFSTLCVRRIFSNVLRASCCTRIPTHGPGLCSRLTAPVPKTGCRPTGPQSCGSRLSSCPAVPAPAASLAVTGSAPHAARAGTWVRG